MFTNHIYQEEIPDDARSHNNGERKTQDNAKMSYFFQRKLRRSNTNYGVVMRKDDLATLNLIYTHSAELT